jgi:3-hydroxy-9,10-secoandrosta-1,3,5(10)-triene-9,17-dione monooxygenase
MSVAETRAPAVQDKIPTAAELVSRAKELATRLRERAERAERERNIPRESVDEYIAAGLIHTLQPRRWGGYEHDHETMFDIAIELGRSTCGSSAWCLNYLGDHACILAHFPEEAQHDVWRRRSTAATGSTAAGRGAAGCVIRSGS